MRERSALCFLLLSGAAASPAQLHAPRWQRLPTGVVKPRGWLLQQAQLQADALTSHLPLFWPDVANTSWLGGDSDISGGLHESTPYWLNGAVPLAAQLEDKQLADVVQRYVEGCLDRQSSSGWLGPDTDPSDFWSRYPFLLALVQLHEALPSNSSLRARLVPAALGFFGEMERRLDGGVGLGSFSSWRAHDLIWTIHYFAGVVQKPPDAQKLLAFAERLHREAEDWSVWFNSSDFPRKAVEGSPTQVQHGVNNAMAVKRGAVWARQSGQWAQGAAESQLAWDMLSLYHGQPSGVFSADEFLAGKMPSRGTELCAVVESMWSLILTAQLSPDDQHATAALDSLELLAFNALPGSLAGDLWSHPYLQFANSYQALQGEKDHVWPNDGPDSAMYGLAPNYECCTANFHQGYAKFIAHLFFEDPVMMALVSPIWAPAAVTTEFVGGGAEVEIRTNYPFGQEVSYYVKSPLAFGLKIRIPAFLRESPESLQFLFMGMEQPLKIQDGFIFIWITASTESREVARFSWRAEPQVRVSPAPEQGASVFLGPLLMALDLKEDRECVKSYEFLAADWNTRGNSSWRWALPSSPRFGEVQWRQPGRIPVKHDATACPVVVNATLLKVPDNLWPSQHNAPGPLPELFGEAGEHQEERVLLAYACSAIRISAFPTSKQVLLVS